MGRWLDRTEGMPERIHPRAEERSSQHPMPTTRRRFLQGSAMAMAGGVLFSCTGGRVVPKLGDPTPGIDTATPIKRVVYVMLENRSFNNLFGRFPGVEATTVGVEFGKEKPLIRCPEWLPGDIPHDRAAHLNCVAGGKMDGFANGEFGSTYAYTVFDEDQIPNYYTWAREYALSDHFFASVGGPSYPNHFYFVAGQSGGVLDNPENIETRVIDGKKVKSWGCDAFGDDVFVFTKDEHGNLAKHDTCFSYRTVGEQLSDTGIDWAYYSAVPGRGTHPRGRRSRQGATADPMPGVAPERHPPRSRRTSQQRERRQDGRLRQRRDRLQLRLLGLRRGPDPELLHVGS